MRPSSLQVLSSILLALLPTLFATPFANGAPAFARAGGEEAARTLLHLDDGRVLRGPARHADGEWSVRLESGWQRVPAARVERAVDEAGALAELADLRATLRRDEPLRRAALADWMVRQGLHEEALRELDRVLAELPDQAQALRSLARIRYAADLPSLDVAPEALPDARRALCAAAAGSRPTVQELAVGRLGELEDQAALLADLRAELVVADPRRRAFAALALRRLFPGAELDVLVRRAAYDAEPEVRRGCALALGRAQDPAVVLPLVRAAAGEAGPLAMRAAEALGHAGYPAAVEPLIASLAALKPAAQGAGTSANPRSHVFFGGQVVYLQDYDVEIAQGASIADPILGVLDHGAVLDVSTHSMSTYRVERHEVVVHDALAQLTGERPGRTTRAWLRWWDENIERWRGRLSADDAAR